MKNRNRRTLVLGSLIACLAATGTVVAAPTAFADADCTEGWSCGKIKNEGTVIVGVFNGWDKPVPDMPGTDDWDTYAQTHFATHDAIWRYWQAHENPETPGTLAGLDLAPGHSSTELGDGFKDTDGFFLGYGYHTSVRVERFGVTATVNSCVNGPIYYQTDSWGGIESFSIDPAPGGCPS